MSIPAEAIEEAQPQHDNIDTPNGLLEPVYEEEEETITIPLNDEPSKPTATATPARYTMRSSSLSRDKQATSVQAGAEDARLGCPKGRLGGCREARGTRGR